MNDRLEIAARVLAEFIAKPLDSRLSEMPEWQARVVQCRCALEYADQLLTAERETRPKCEHKRTARFSPEPYNIEADYLQCLDCGAEVQP